MSISDALIIKRAMSTAEVEYLFWMGIPPELAVLFEQKLQFILPNHDTRTPYPIATICAIAEKHFKHDKFTEMMLSTPYLDSDNTSSDSDDTSGSDSELRPMPLKYSNHNNSNNSKDLKMKLME